tara:strand:+ start:323 stop:637 length:315 start_codon:yes stop_codon:yes gene_type:complete
MSYLYFYLKNLKVFHRSKLTKKKNIDWYISLGDHLIVEGLRKGISIPRQIETYEFFIKIIQKQKKYKITKSDAELYFASILAMVKLGQYDYDDADSPIWISPAM